jgi:hypothetical protein
MLEQLEALESFAAAMAAQLAEDDAAGRRLMARWNIEPD